MSSETEVQVYILGINISGISIFPWDRAICIEERVAINTRGGAGGKRERDVF